MKYDILEYETFLKYIEEELRGDPVTARSVIYILMQWESFKESQK